MKNTNLMIRISEDLKEKAKDMAKEKNKTLSEYVLDLIKKDLILNDKSL